MRYLLFPAIKPEIANHDVEQSNLQAKLQHLTGSISTGQKTNSEFPLERCGMLNCEQLLILSQNIESTLHWRSLLRVL